MQDRLGAAVLSLGEWERRGHGSQACGGWLGGGVLLSLGGSRRGGGGGETEERTEASRSWQCCPKLMGGP